MTDNQILTTVCEGACEGLIQVKRRPRKIPSWEKQKLVEMVGERSLRAQPGLRQGVRMRKGREAKLEDSVTVKIFS